MKYLTDYTNKPLEELFNNNGAFFAFSDKQFEEAKDKKLKKEDYTNLMSGLICPKNNVKAVLNGIEEITKRGIEEDITENGLNAIIRRELSNHECYYTGDITDAINALEDYGVSREDVQRVFKDNNAEVIRQVALN